MFLRNALLVIISCSLASCADLAGGILLQVNPVAWCMNNSTYINNENERRRYCEGEFMDDQRRTKDQAKAMDLEEKRKFEQSSSGKLLNNAIQALQGGASSSGSAGGSGIDTSISCKGKASCTFQMPSIACGKYSNYSYPGGYSFEQTNICPYEIIYKLTIYQGPNFSPYGGYQARPRLRPYEKIRGGGMFSKSNSIKVVDDYSCRTIEDVSQMIGMKLSSGGPAANATLKSGCYYVTSPDPVRTSQ